MRATRYTYNTLGQLTQLDGPQGTVTLRYDASGNLIERKDKSGRTVQYAWDYESRLAAVNDGATTVKFAYDGDGRRLAKTVNGRKTQYVQGGNLLPQVLVQMTDGQMVRSLFGLSRNGEVSAQGTRFYLEDGLGSVVGVADATGKLTSTVEYDAFGAPRGSSTSSTTFGYAGEQYDTETGLLFLRARYYNPGLGRFISRDPLSGSLTDPQSQNRYAYVQNNPATHVDPSGLQGPDRFRVAPHIIQPQPSGIDRVLPYAVGALNAGKPVVNAVLDTWTGKPADSLAEQRVVTTLVCAECVASFTPIAPAVRIYATLRAVSNLIFLPKVASETGNGYSFVGPFISTAGKAASWHYAISGAAEMNVISKGFALYGAGKSLMDLATYSSHGGVSLDKTAQVFVNLNDISGATVDPKTGQLILIGKQDTRLPPMNLDDLVVAVRSVYAGKDPGVTMVPVDPSWKDRTQRVEYFGATENTRFGLTMFEADRYLKGLAAGKDTFTGKPVTPNVPGFKPEIDLSCEKRTSVPWHRNWFVPNEVVLKQSADGKSMVFERATMRLESRFIKFNPDGTVVDVPGTSPVTDEFTRFVTNHYDELAKEKPELAELTRLAKIVGVAKWIRDNNIPVDLSWVGDYKVARVETPKTTPGVSAEKVCLGSTFVIVSQGGVDFGTEDTYTKEDGQVTGLRDKAVTSRPAALPVTWSFDQAGTTYTAVALNLAPSKTIGGYVTSQTDLTAQAPGSLPFQFTRFYNSLNIRNSSLGYGWTFVPYKLTIQQVANKPKGVIESQVILFDAARQSTETFEGPYKEDKTGRVFYLPQCKACGYIDLSLQSDKGYALRLQDHTLVLFNAQGQLAGFADDNGNRVEYRYSAERLSEISASGGTGLKLDYDNGGRISQVKSSDGRTVKYTFDNADQLVGVRDTHGITTTYAYDSTHLLTKVMDAAGQMLLENQYDSIGRLLEQKGAQGYTVTAQYDPATRQATYIDSLGQRSIQFYDDKQRLIKQTDPLSQTIAYVYDKDGNVASVTDKRGQTTSYAYDRDGNLTQITTPLTTTTQFSYDANHNLRYAIDPLRQMVTYEYDSRNNLTRVVGGLKVTRLDSSGVQYDSSRALSTQFEYNANGSLKATIDPNGQRSEFGYDAHGNLMSVKSSGREMRQEFDARSRVTKVIDPLGRSTRYEYDDRDWLTKMTAAAGTLQYEYDSKGNLTQVTDANGNVTQYAYDINGNLVQVTDATGAKTQYEYDTIGNLVTVIDANQRRTRYEYDVLRHVIRETFQ